MHADFSSAPIDITQNTSQGVREDTAELASWALSDIASHRNGHSPSRLRASSSTQQNLDSLNGQDSVSHRDSSESSRPDVIPEVSELSTPQNEPASYHARSHSALTEMIRQSPPNEDSSNDTEDEGPLRSSGVQPVTVREGIISQPHEQTSLLLKKAAYGSGQSPIYGSAHDLENQRLPAQTLAARLNDAYTHSKAHLIHAFRVVENPKSWDGKEIWTHAVKRPASYVPPVILGLLLNVLDALSYGMRCYSVEVCLTDINRNDSVSLGRTYLCTPRA